MFLGSKRTIRSECIVNQVMSISPLLQQATIWLAWSGLGLGVITLISFLIGWGVKFRLTGITIFTLLLSVSCWAFSKSYTPPLVVEGAIFTPVVYDNGYDLVVAQAPENFPQDSIEPSLQQIAGNLKGGGRSGSKVHVRIRKVESAGDGISQPVILGEVIRDISNQTTSSVSFQKSPKEENIEPLNENEVTEDI